MRAKPLAGIRVLDLTRLLPGPMCTLHLADMGADVIKIEGADGDPARKLGATGGDAAPLFCALNRNKRSLSVDLKQTAGRDLFRRLAEHADVIIEGFRPGVVDKLGVGYDAVAASNPRIVYCALTGYGQTGPYRDEAGHDLNYCAIAGVADQIGAATPAIPNFQIADIVGALTAAMGILAALIDAQKTGRGRYIDVAMTDAVLAHAIFPLIALQSECRIPERGGALLSGGYACYNVYATADSRFMAVAALERKFWDRVCDVLARPELKTAHLEGAEQSKAKAVLERIFNSQSQEYWKEKFRGRDSCVTPLLRLDETLSDAQIKARGMFVDTGEHAQFALPLKFSDFEFTVAREAPRLGEHSNEVLAAFGYSADAIDELRRSQVI